MFITYALAENILNSIEFLQTLWDTLAELAIKTPLWRSQTGDKTPQRAQRRDCLSALILLCAGHQATEDRTSGWVCCSCLCQIMQQLRNIRASWDVPGRVWDNSVSSMWIKLPRPYLDATVQCSVLDTNYSCRVLQLSLRLGTLYQQFRHDHGKGSGSDVSVVMCVKYLIATSLLQ